MKRTNPMAKDLRTPKYRTRVIKSKKEYNRKENKRKTDKNSLKGLNA